MGITTIRDGQNIEPHDQELYRDVEPIAVVHSISVEEKNCGAAPHCILAFLFVVLFRLWLNNLARRPPFTRRESFGFFAVRPKVGVELGEEHEVTSDVFIIWRRQAEVVERDFVFRWETDCVQSFMT